VITKDVPPGALAVERAEQRVVPGYRKRKDDERASSDAAGAVRATKKKKKKSRKPTT
jgi:hypothetical protein